MTRLERKGYLIKDATKPRALEITHAGLDAYSRGAIKAAFQDIVGVQFRNGATLGGSLWRRMGFSDIVTAFLAMDSYVELHEGGIVPLERFVNMPACMPDRAVHGIPFSGPTALHAAPASQPEVRTINP